MKVQWEYALDIAAGDVRKFDISGAHESSTPDVRRLPIQGVDTCAVDQRSTVSFDGRAVERISAEQNECGVNSAEDGLWLYS